VLLKKHPHLTATTVVAVAVVSHGLIDVVELVKKLVKPLPTTLPLIKIKNP
jgi:hypothetical protein